MGVLGAVVHRHDADLVGVDVPWGLLVALAPLVPLVLVADRTVSLGGAAIMIGWGAVLVLQSSASPGQYLIGDDPVGWTYTLLGLALLVVTVIGNSRLRR
ncbi:hypothetical protein [Aeromicrobium sp. Leaf350]|uniref:hypothetical protein n=1 Tax=Aeromicrobium sp. Leaf350 TaxID=2876565 RepID=UPI001E50B732|nr:hypothetical protein [Aeromicrobium sp. Leaf350]